MLWIKQCVEEAHTSDAAYHPGKVILTYSFFGVGRSQWLWV